MMTPIKEIIKLRKMSASKDANNNVSYTLESDGQSIDMSALIGQSIKLTNTGIINCVECGSKTDKSYQQGYCGACAATLAKCDSCRIKPELCGYYQGNCRQPEWGEQECLQDHIVYLAYSSGYKVGITRTKNLPNRWIDQGAAVAVPLFKVSERLVAGVVETAFKEFVSDRTNFRVMLMSDESPSDTEVQQEAERLCKAAQQAVDNLQLRFGKDAIERAEPTVERMVFPIGERPFEKVGMPHNMDKTPELSGVLHGIKGQYLYIGNKVVNIRKYAGYNMIIETP